MVTKPSSSSSTLLSTLLPPSPSAVSASSLPVPQLRHDRPAVLVSSTSWTADEDFSILLDALTLYETEARKGEGVEEAEGQSVRLPKVVVVVSGKGPGRAAWEVEVERRREREGWRWVGVWCAWVEVEDYPRLLGESRTYFPGRIALARLLTRFVCSSCQAPPTWASRCTRLPQR